MRQLGRWHEGEQSPSATLGSWVGGWSNRTIKEGSVNVLVAERPWSQLSVTGSWLEDPECVLPTCKQHATVLVEHRSCNNNFLSFNGHCASILTENQVDPRESMKHENLILVGRKRTRPRLALPPKGIWKSQRSLLPS